MKRTVLGINRGFLLHARTTRQNVIVQGAVLRWRWVCFLRKVKGYLLRLTLRCSGQTGAADNAELGAGPIGRTAAGANRLLLHFHGSRHIRQHGCLRLRRSLLQPCSAVHAERHFRVHGHTALGTGFRCLCLRFLRRTAGQQCAAVYAVGISRFCHLPAGGADQPCRSGSGMRPFPHQSCAALFADRPALSHLCTAAGAKGLRFLFLFFSFFQLRRFLHRLRCRSGCAVHRRSALFAEDPAVLQLGSADGAGSNHLWLCRADLLSAAGAEFHSIRNRLPAVGAANSRLRCDCSSSRLGIQNRFGILLADKLTSALLAEARAGILCHHTTVWADSNGLRHAAFHSRLDLLSALLAEAGAVLELGPAGFTFCHGQSSIHQGVLSVRFPPGRYGFRADQRTAALAFVSSWAILHKSARV